VRKCYRAATLPASAMARTCISRGPTVRTEFERIDRGENREELVQSTVNWSMTRSMIDQFPKAAVVVNAPLKGALTACHMHQ
jgi:hypothetical protein